MEPLHCNAIEGSVVQHHHSIGIQGQALQGQQGVVGLNHHITRLILVWEDTASQAVCVSENCTADCARALGQTKPLDCSLDLLHRWCMGDREEKVLSPWQGWPAQGGNMS